MSLVPIQFGARWLEPDGRYGALQWHPTTGDLIFEHADGTFELVGTITDEAMVRTRLIDWADYQQFGLGWIRGRVAPSTCPLCKGEGWIGENFFDDESVAVPCCLCRPVAS